MEKLVTFGNKGHININEQHLAKWVTLNLEKWVTLEKMGRIWKNGSDLEEGGHTSKIRKNKQQLEKWVTLEKRVTLGEMGGHTWKNGSHLEKWVKLGKKGHS